MIVIDAANHGHSSKSTGETCNQQTVERNRTKNVKVTDTTSGEVESRIRVVQHSQKKSTLNDEFRRNLSVIAKSIATKLLIASNPSSSSEEQKDSLNEILSQINTPRSLVDNNEENSTNFDKKDDQEDILRHEVVSDTHLQKTLADYFVRVISGMNELMDEVKVVANNTQVIKSLLFKTGHSKVMSCKQLAEKYNYVIPLPTAEEFERFDKELGDSNSTLRLDTSVVLLSGLDRGLVMSKCIVKMLKMFITKDVAVQFTAVKQAKGKKIMKNTNLFNCIEAIIKERRNTSNLTTSDKEMTAALSVVMTNAQHWHRRQQSDSTRRNQQIEQDSTSQNDLIGTYEVVNINETDPLLEVKYID